MNLLEQRNMLQVILRYMAKTFEDRKREYNKLGFRESLTDVAQNYHIKTLELESVLINLNEQICMLDLIIPVALNEKELGIQSGG